MTSWWRHLRASLIHAGTQAPARLGDPGPEVDFRLTPWNRLPWDGRGIRFSNIPSAEVERQLNDERPWPRTAAEFRDRLFEKYRFTSEAQAYLAERIHLQVDDFRSKAGGGLWFGAPASRVQLNSVQEEAGIHEFAHAWFDQLAATGRLSPPDFIHDVRRLADDPTAEPFLRAIASYFVYGVAGDGRVETNSDLRRHHSTNATEMYASLASGMMGFLGRAPDYLRPYYRSLFAG